MKEQYQLKNIVRYDVRINLIPPKHDCGNFVKGTLRSLAVWPASKRRLGRMIILSPPPTSKGMNTNVTAKTMPPATPGRSARASRRFVSKSWVEIVLAGGELFGQS